MRWIIAVLGLSLTAACGARAEPPRELAGLWSTGEASCAAGVGIRFTADAIEAAYDDEQSETLFERPRYRVVSSGDAFRVRVTYDLPRVAGRARPGAHGVIVLARRGGMIAPEAHTLVDGMTGSARMRIADDPVVTALTLQPCGRHPWREPLRGLTAT